MLRLLTVCVAVLASSMVHAENILSFGEWSIDATGSGSAEVMWTSSETIAGFQFDVNGVTLTAVDGGITEKMDWLISHNTFRVLGVALTAESYIPPQPTATLLLTLHFENAGDVINFEGVLFVDNLAKAIKVDSSDEIIVTPECIADINGDGTVDVVDLLEVVGSWGESNVPADINGDGIVNVSDLLAVVDAWGLC